MHQLKPAGIERLPGQQHRHQRRRGKDQKNHQQPGHLARPQRKPGPERHHQCQLAGFERMKVNRHSGQRKRRQRPVCVQQGQRRQRQGEHRPGVGEPGGVKQLFRQRVVMAGQPAADQEDRGPARPEHDPAQGDDRQKNAGRGQEVQPKIKRRQREDGQDWCQRPVKQARVGG